MMRWIVGWSMQLRLLLVAAAAVLIFFGVTELRNMPVDVVPEFSRPYVEVQTEALGLSAAEVEAMITVPLEADMLNGMPWVDEIRSESMPGLSSIVMFFEPGTDLLTARQVVQERLVGVHALPSVSTPPAMLQPVSSTSRFLKVGLTSDSRSLIELSVLARWTVVPRLIGVPGVANVSIWGQRRRQLQVQVDPAELRERGVELEQVIETAGNALWVSPLSFLDASTPGTGGWIETPNQRLGVQHIFPISTPEELALVSVEGTSLNLGEIATVVEDHQPLIGDAIVDDAPALMLVVEKFPWANTVDVTRDVESALAALQLGLPGVRMNSSLFRPATYLELATGNLASAAWIAFALLVVALVGLLFSWRTALISTLAVVLSAVTAVTVLYVRGVTINMMIIAGLMVALAALIDDAIIDIQNISRRLRGREAGDDDSRARVIFEAALQMRGPIVYATLVLLLVIAPLFFLDGVIGTFSQALASSYALALLASVLVALTVTPALSLLLLGDASTEGGDSPVLGSLRNGARALLTAGMRAPVGAVATTVAIVGAAVILGAALNPPNAASLLPQFRERDILLELDSAPGTSEPEMRRIVSRASSELRALPGVRTVSAHMGRAVMSDRVTDVDGAELWVSVDSGADYDATVSEIRATMSGYPGFDIDVDTYLMERMREEAETDDGPVVRVYGESLDTVREKAEEVRDVLAGVGGVQNAQVEYPIERPNLEIEVDLAKAQEHGVKPGDVRRMAATLLSGIQVGSLFEDQKVFDVVVWGVPEIRRNLSDVENLLIETPRGSVKLKEVASLRIASSPNIIEREGVARHIDVTADLGERDFAAVSAEATERIRQNVEFPLEYRAELLGEFGTQLASSERALSLAVAAAIGIVLLLQAAFGSWSLAFMFFLCLPAALVGGGLAALAGGGLASLGALFGLLAVLGIAVRNGMSLIHHYRQLERQEGAPRSADLVQRGTEERLAPIVMTAVVTALAFLPFALFGGIAGHEILYPMALVMLGGLVTTTLVTLLVVPALYLRFGSGSETLDIIEADEEAERLIA